VTLWAAHLHTASVSQDSNGEERCDQSAVPGEAQGRQCGKIKQIEIATQTSQSHLVTSDQTEQVWPDKWQLSIYTGATIYSLMKCDQHCSVNDAIIYRYRLVLSKIDSGTHLQSVLRMQIQSRVHWILIRAPISNQSQRCPENWLSRHYRAQPNAAPSWGGEENTILCSH